MKKTKKKFSTLNYIIMCATIFQTLNVLAQKEVDKSAIERISVTGLNFGCTVIDGYFEIEGEVYQSNDILYMCIENIGVNTNVEIFAYSNTGDPFPANTEWYGEGLNTSHLEGPSTIFEKKEAPITIDEPFVITASYVDDGVTHLMKINIVIVIVELEFNANPNQLYGFDDNKWPNTADYPSNYIPHNFSWKSVKSNSSDMVDFEVKPVELNEINFSSSVPNIFTVSPTSMSTNPQILTTSVGANGVGVITAQGTGVNNNCSSVINSH